MTSVSQSQQIMESASLHPLMHVPPHVLAVFKMTFARTARLEFYPLDKSGQKKRKKSLKTRVAFEKFVERAPNL